MPEDFSIARSLGSFRRDECGAISVDFVVLTFAATAMAMVSMAAFSAEISFLSSGVADGMQQREPRPSYAYRAHDEETYLRFTAAVSSLSTDDLAVLSSWGNATRMQRDTMTDPKAVRFFDDFDSAITSAYAKRSQSRDAGAVDYEDYDLDRISRMLGFS